MLRILWRQRLKGVVLGLQLAVNLDIQDVIIESDCLDLIEVCRGKKTKQQIISFISEIQELKSQIQKCAFTWTPREGNEVAHALAKLKAVNKLPGNWLQHPPNLLRSAIAGDRLAAMFGGQEDR